MGWAVNHIKKLQAGETIQFKPRGNSMKGKINSGNLVTVEPINDQKLKKGDIVLCKVKGREYLHLVKATRYRGKFTDLVAKAVTIEVFDDGKHE